MTSHTIVSPEHAIVTGYVFGLAAKHGLVLRPDVDEHGLALASAVIELPGLRGDTVVRIVVSPPEVEP